MSGVMTQDQMTVSSRRTNVSASSDETGIRYATQTTTSPPGLDPRNSARKQRQCPGRISLQKLHQIAKSLSASIGVKPSVSIRKLVKLPKDADVNEWLAVHVVEFYNDICLLFGTIDAASKCTEETCPHMTIGPRYKFLWIRTITEDEAGADSVPSAGNAGLETGRSLAPNNAGAWPKQRQEHIDAPAPVYIDMLLEWIDNLLDDPTSFPQNDEQTYRPDFMQVLVRAVFRRLFRVFGHMYHSHFNFFVAMGTEVHLNNSFRRFIFFALEFALLNDEDTRPMRGFIRFIQREEEEKLKL